MTIDSATWLVLIPTGIIALSIWRSRMGNRPHVSNGDGPAVGTEELTQNEVTDSLLAEIRSLKREYESDNKKRAASDKSSHRWNVATTLGVWVYTLLTLAITVTTIDQIEISKKSANAAQTAASAAKNSADANVGQLDQMKNSGRAWLSPSEAQLDHPLANGFPLMFHILYQNSGREPATAIVNNIIVNTISNIPALPDWEKSPFPANKTCDYIYPVEGARIAYPGTSTYTLSQSLLDKPMGRLTFDAVQAQAVIFVVNGCLKYITLGKPHKSSFCFYLKPISGDGSAGWEFKICPTGNEAD